MLSYHSCHIYGSCKGIYVGEYFRVIIGGGQATKGWKHFHGGSSPLETPCKDLNLAIRGGLGWME